MAPGSSMTAKVAAVPVSQQLCQQQVQWGTLHLTSGSWHEQGRHC